MVAGAASLAAGILTGGLADIAVVPPVVGGTGAIALLANALRLPRWAGEREKQMDYIAARVTAIMKTAEEKS